MITKEIKQKLDLLEEITATQGKQKAIETANQWLSENIYIPDDYIVLGILHKDDIKTAMYYFGLALALNNNLPGKKPIVYEQMIDTFLKIKNNVLAMTLCRYAISSFCTSKSIVRLLQEMTGDNIPGMLISFQPKSASVYIRDILLRHLPIGHFNLDQSANGGRTQEIHEYQMVALANGFATAHNHLPATPENKHLISKYLPKMVVHVRDPRSTAVSFAHMVNNPKSDLYNRYEKFSIEEQIDLQVKKNIPEDVKWISGWLEAEKDPDFTTEIKFTRYDDLVDDGEGFFRNIFEYYGIDPDKYMLKVKKPSKSGESQYREGKKYGWRDDLNEEQKKLAQKLIPEEFFDRFDWPLA